MEKTKIAIKLVNYIFLKLGLEKSLIDHIYAEVLLNTKIYSESTEFRDNILS